ncbi:hypothetical protein DW886_17225 [Enterocloster aldenensis]|uniref:hypothetical protein n=1 Tax=Enterocloster aldenensis TaxID=358742 RepID=UPI000E54BD67|nr:hypothetical protein DW886_17225 [Enterocloster aldenensis]
MVFLIISYVLIIAGFVLVYVRKKRKKSEIGLKVAKITNVKQNDGNYELTIKYSFDEGTTFLEGIILSERKKTIGEDVIIQVLDDDSVELYKDDKIILFASFGCWILGILILCLFCK